VEHARWGRLLQFGIGVAAHPAKLLQAVALKASLGAVPYLTGAWVVRAEGTEQLGKVQIRHASGERTIDCDYLAVAYGLTPNTELASLFGCALGDGLVKVDDFQHTDRDDIFCA